MRNPLHQIHGFSQFMVSLVNDLLDVAKIESGKLTLRREEIDLAVFVARNISLNEALAAKKQIEIRLQNAYSG